MSLSAVHVEVAALLCYGSARVNSCIKWCYGSTQSRIQSSTNFTCKSREHSSHRSANKNFFLQNVFNSILCLLFSILLALVQFRVIRDSYLPLLCYGIMFFMAAFCFISMPTVGNIFPVDTRDVSVTFLFKHKHTQGNNIDVLCFCLSN